MLPSNERAAVPDELERWVREVLGYLFCLTFSRADWLFDYVFLSNDTGGGGAVMDVRVDMVETVYRARATLPSNRVNHFLLTSSNVTAAKLKENK